MASVITSISGLQHLPNLQNLNADYNALVSLDVSGLTNLTYVDVSDCDLVNSEGEASLSSINVSGCTALEQLRIDDSNFSGVMPNLTGLTSLQYFDLDQSNIAGDIDISASSFNALTGFDLSGNTITSIIIPEAPLSDVNLYNNALTETAVNNVLQWLGGNGIENGYVDLSGGTNAIPTGNGATAKATLQSRGWNVYVNQAPPASVGIAASTDFDIVGDFTIEMFVNLTDLGGFPRPYSFGAYPAPNAMSIEGGQLYFWGNNSNLINGAFSPTVGQWYHICAMGSGSTAYMFIDGFMVASSPYAGSISSQGLPLTIGFGNEPGSGFNGLMSNFRWTSFALYDPAGFAVPTSTLPNVAGTKLLTFQGPSLPQQLADLSGNGHNVTNSGATYSANNPFAGTQGSLQMGNV